MFLSIFSLDDAIMCMDHSDQDEEEDEDETADEDTDGELVMDHNVHFLFLLVLCYN